MALLLASMARPASAPTPEQVADSIDYAKAYLYSRRLHGNWEAVATRNGGIEDPNDPNGLQLGAMTAIAPFALLAAGDNPRGNEHLKAATDFLEKADMKGIYAIGIRSQISNDLPEDETVKKIRRRDKQTLLDDDHHGSGEEAGLLSYGQGMQRQEIKKYVDAGETLLIDAAGSKSAFALAAQQELGRIFPGNCTPAILPIKSEVYTAVGDRVTDVTYGSFARRTLGNLRAPQVCGIEMGKRVGVFLSNEDLSVGMVGQPVDGIIGYDPASATHIVENIVLYALN